MQHILVDEAQDTNPAQWALIQNLADDFFSGHGQHSSDGPPRTLFVVGDYKQSIYSFQGADPDLFLKMRDHFAQKARAAQATWHDISLNISFRSSPKILEVVNRVFEGCMLGDGAPYHTHHAAHNFTGEVWRWPLIQAEPEPEAEPWSLPTAWSPSTQPTEQLAKKITAQIRTWLDEKRWLHSRNRPITPGDIMILVRRRHHFVDDLRRCFKQADIPTMGLDQLQLADHINVQDTLAVGDFILNPQDDLNLAALLKSPLLALSETQLFTLAYNRGSHSLWMRLQQHPEPWAQAATKLLNHWASHAHSVPLYTFFQTLIHASKERWPATSWDVLSVFLEYVEVYCRTQLASLPHFISWLRSGSPLVPKDALNITKDAVRILTIHSAKGLQAPVVFLPDTTHLPKIQDRVLTCDGVPIFAAGGWSKHPKTTAIKQVYQKHHYQEYLRLLYVALTRAEENLIIGGWYDQTKELPPECWYNLLEPHIAQTENIR